MISEQKFIEDIQQICGFSLKLCKNPWIIKNVKLIFLNNIFKNI